MRWWVNRDTPPTDEGITLVTWNLQWFPGKKPKTTPEEEKQHMREVQEALADMGADIYCFQEVRSGEAVEELIAGHPDLKVDVISNFKKIFGNSQQVAIVSRFPAISAFAEPFVAHEEIDPPRGFTYAALDAGDGLLVLVYCLHLKSNIGDLEKNIGKREESVRQLVSHVKETEPLLRDQGWDNILLVVAGDMNTDPADVERFGDEQTFTLLKELGLESDLEDVPLTKRVTLPAEGRYPDAGFDWILVRPVEGVKWRSKVAMPGDEISDHRPVVLEMWSKDTS
jgi:endonuclease/exonuclease/phosphatase family metal-dependent hydrolase